MMLFQKRFHAGLVDGSVTLTFRRWTKPMVAVGGRYRCHPIGVLQVDGVRKVRASEIRADDARRAGFRTRAELLAYLEEGPVGPLRRGEELFRIELHHAGDEDAKAHAFVTEITGDELQKLRMRLDALDRDRPWTLQTLELIEAHPHRRAGDLADILGREKLDFKTDVRKLKALGLTMSHEVGYSLSPRGEAYLKLAR